MAAEETDIVRRLVLVKQAFFHAHEHSRDQTQLGRCFAIHGFDYCIEAMLWALFSLADGAPAGARNWAYDTLLGRAAGILKEVKGAEIPYQRDIRTIRDQRNLFQHHGTVPSFEAVTRAADVAETFLRQLMRLAFDLAFDELTLGDLIEDEKIRNFYKEAETAFSEENWQDCATACARAFESATAHSRQRWHSPSIWNSSSLEWGLRELLDSVLGPGRVASWPRDLSRFVDNAQRQLQELEEQMQVITVGGNYRRYQRFKSKTPSIDYSSGGSTHVIWPGNLEVSRDDCIESLNFVLDTALEAQSIPLPERVT